MKSIVTAALTAFFCLCIAIATASPAYGYVDPGSGLLALQGAATAAAAVAYVLRRRVLSFFVRSEQNPNDTHPGPTKQSSSAKAA